jgi:hypothetical protein
MESAMTDTLEGMTHDKWRRLSEREREKLRDLSGLSPQLKGLEGWRVQVVDQFGHTRRFIVGRSTGWRPCHLEVKRSNSHGGNQADSEYRSVRRLEKVHP